MKKIPALLFFTAIILNGCGGGGGGKSADPIVTPSSSAASSSLLATSSSTSSSSSSSSSSSIKSVASSSSIAPSSSSSSLSSISAASSSVASPVAFTLTSNSFVHNADIPIKYSCFSTQVSPHLKWDITSDAVKSFALIMEDIDAIAIVGHPYVHWDVYNIPGSVREITEGATLRAMPMGSLEGVNDDNVPKYAGPCPPTGTGTHHYYFALYALNTETLPVDTGKVMRRSDFETRYVSNIIQKVEIIGLFKP